MMEVEIEHESCSSHEAEESNGDLENHTNFTIKTELVEHKPKIPKTILVTDPIKLCILPKSPRHIQHFRPQWKKEFAWLTESPKGSIYFRCKACRKDLIGGITEIRRHAVRRFHEIKEAERLLNEGEGLSNDCDEDVIERVTENELRLAMFMVENNIPVTAASRLTDLIKVATNLIPGLLNPDSQSNPDSSNVAINTMDTDGQCEEIQNMASDVTRTNVLIENVVEPSAYDELIEHLRSQKFSLIVGESTNESTKNQVVVVARCVIDGKACDTFLTRLVVSSLDHRSIYNEMISFFKKHSIPYCQNMIGFAADGCNDFSVESKFLANRLQEDIPELYTLALTCHSLEFCASNAVSKLPNKTEQLIKDLYLYLANIPTSSCEFPNVRHLLFSAKQQKLLSLSMIKWLSVMPYVDTVVEQFDDLLKFFEKEALDEHNLRAGEISKSLLDPLTYLYLQFLKENLRPIMNTSKKLLAKDVVIHLLYPSILALYRRVLDCYINESLTNGDLIFTVMPDDPENFLDLEDMFLGSETTASIAKVIRKGLATPEAVKSFRKRCQMFFVELAIQLLNIFPLSDTKMDVLKLSKFIVPSELFHIRSLSPIIHFFNFDLISVDSEYRLLRKAFRDNYVPDIYDFWNKVEHEHPTSFPNIIHLKNMMLLLPNPSEECKNIFCKSGKDV